MNEDSFIKFDSNLNIAKIKFDINSKEAIINAFGLRKNSDIFKFIDSFGGGSQFL